MCSLEISRCEQRVLEGFLRVIIDIASFVEMRHLRVVPVQRRTRKRVSAAHVLHQETGGAVSLRVACAPVVLQHSLQLRAIRTGGAEGTTNPRWAYGAGKYTGGQYNRCRNPKK